jgi:nitrogen fixation/metabolism regulation signal transduction histidine kinase
MRFFRQFHIQVLIRLVLMLAFVGLGIYLLNRHLYFSAVGVMVVALLFIWSLAKYVHELNSEVDIFLSAIRNRDNGVYFDPARYGKPFSTLFTAFNEIVQMQKSVAIEKEAIFQLMNNTLEKAPFGIMVIPQQACIQPGGEYVIEFANSAVENILQIPRFKYWNRVVEYLPDFAKHVSSLQNGGKKFIENFRGGETVLSLETQLIFSEGKPLLIVSFQDIKDEMEQKEMEAWNKLINVLTHEILNSITPINSLSYSIKKILDEKGRNLDEEDVMDLKLGAATIQKRSDGLMAFVNDYRHVASLPSPVLQPLVIHDLLQQVKHLMQPLAEKKSVLLQVDPIHPRYILEADEKLVEQVLINLVTNSIYALENRPNPFVQVMFVNHQDYLALEIKDNGKGIPAENMDKIFVPFFTTRSNGSGIGLTISRNIMKLHNGWIEVESVENTGSVFRMIFPRKQS